VDLAELLAIPGVVEQCVLRSPVGFLALHGGSQDRGTDALAREAAERSGASFYAIVQPPTLRVHITSRHHRREQSVALNAFLDHVRIAISVHGFGRDSLTLQAHPSTGIVFEPYGPAVRPGQPRPLTGIIVGGRNPALLAAARELFDTRWPGFHVADERLRLGFHRDNPVNLPPEHGVQIELPPGLRGIGPYGERLIPGHGAGHGAGSDGSAGSAGSDGSADVPPSDVVDALVELADRAAALVPGVPWTSP
jgi:phage replication-related protein YjqB (UPF0714/DUF867 family)